MRLTKALGLAIMAALVAMAFLGASNASAQHQIALCKSLVVLCGADELWKAGTEILALAANPKLETSIGNITCEDSKVKAKLSTTLGNPLVASNPEVSFGVLPTPTLGTGCTGICVNGNPNSIHVQLEKLEVIVEAINKYSLRGTGLALILNCPFGTCVYRGVDLVSPIKHDGTHLEHPNADNLPLAEFAETLNRQTSHGGSIFCPSTSKWTASYVLTLAHHEGVSGLAWPSLDK
jgi:hypothetical protein